MSKYKLRREDITGFVRNLKREERSPGTIAKYLRDVNAFLLVAALVIGGTLAYFTDTKTATNTFTVGNVTIDLSEPAWDASGKIDAPESYPGEALAKDPTVTNTGANPCLVRIHIGWPEQTGALEYRTDYVSNKLGDNWVYGGDGYFYYLKALPVNGKTDALFDQIVVPADLTNEDATVDYNVVVTAYAVQAQGVFPSFSTVQDIDVDTELPTVKAFFNNAFASAS